MAVEVAPVGREGMVGPPVFLGVTASPNHVFAQIPGASGTGTRRARQVRLDCDALRLETYIQYATRDGDSELADLFRKAQAYSREGAEMGKQLLRSRLASSYDRFRDGLPAHPPRQGTRSARSG
jgi:hypothetical protein